jgi:putative Mn2+ efflux pump MntP
MGALILLAVSVSIDSLSTGMAYGMAGIRIPGVTKGIIAVIGGALTFAAVVAGNYLSQIIPAIWFRLFSSGILVGMGAKTLWSVCKNQAVKDYDQNGSKVLEPLEGILIGLTMAADSVSAGVAIAQSGNERYAFPFLAAAAGALFLSIGNYVRVNVRFLNAIGAVLLILLGVLRYFAS